MRARNLAESCLTLVFLLSDMLQSPIRLALHILLPVQLICMTCLKRKTFLGSGKVPWPFGIESALDMRKSGNIAKKKLVNGITKTFESLRDPVIVLTRSRLTHPIAYTMPSDYISIHEWQSPSTNGWVHTFWVVHWHTKGKKKMSDLRPGRIQTPKPEHRILILAPTLDIWRWNRARRKNIYKKLENQRSSCRRRFETDNPCSGGAGSVSPRLAHFV